MTDLILHLTAEQHKHIEAMARQRGYETTDDYLLALVELDTQSAPVLQDGKDELPPDSFEATFRQTLHDIMSGYDQPNDNLVSRLDDD